jgi:formiminotetrahydrofolate cyclodeaminase
VPARVSESTLEQFRNAAASPQPAPAGVAVAAVSAGFALGLLAKVLVVSGRRKELSAHRARLESMTAATQAASERMLQLAGDDSAAFEGYLAARRLPRATEQEREERERVVHAAVRRTIAVPLAAAQEAAAGLRLCSDACGLIPPALIADLGVTATLLASALRAFLLCAESNVRQLAPDPASYRELLATGKDLKEQALAQAEAVLERAAAAVTAAASGRGA